MATMTVKDAADLDVTIEKPLAPGRGAAAASRPVVLSTEDAASLTAIAASVAGTLTVGSHAVTNAGTFATQAAQSGAWNITNVSGTVSLPTGAATVASQATANTSLGAIAASVAGTLTVGSHAVTNAGTFAVQASVAALPARTATADAITAKLATDAIQNGLTALTPKFAAIAASSSGNNTLVAAVTSKKIRVLAYNFMANGAVNGKFQSGASGTDLTGLKYMDGAGAGIVAPFNPIGWFETGSNTLLNLNLSGAVAVGGELVYVEV